MLYNESDETNIATFTKEGASRKYYTSFYILAQKGLHTIGEMCIRDRIGGLMTKRKRELKREALEDVYKRQDM